MTGMIFTYHQVTFSAEETVQAKLAYERELENYNHNVKHYHADNGIFKSQEFKDSISIRGQKITFSGVGAHHQNGKAERAIQTVVEKARAMMLHVSMHWPEYFSMDLWPYAIDYATFIYNHTPGEDTGVAPIEHMSNVHMNCKHISRCKVFGCPVYVLQAKLQDGKKIPKWKPRARMGQFLGFSPDHSTLVGLVRNLRMEHVLPQWHLVFDERFETVTTSESDQEEAAAIWTNLFNAPESRDWYFDKNDTEPTTVPPQLESEWQDNDDLETARTRRARRRARIRAQAQAAHQNNNNDDSDLDSEGLPPAPSKDDDIRPTNSGETGTGSTPDLLDDSPEQEESDSESCDSDGSSSSSDSEDDNDGSSTQGEPTQQQAPIQGEPGNQGEPEPGRAPGQARRCEVHPDQLPRCSDRIHK